MAYAMQAVEAKNTMQEKAAKVERAHDSLLEERLEKEREWCATGLKITSCLNET